MIILEKQQIAEAKRRAKESNKHADNGGLALAESRIKTRSREKTTSIARLIFYNLMITLEKQQIAKATRWAKEINKHANNGDLLWHREKDNGLTLAQGRATGFAQA